MMMTAGARASLAEWGIVVDRGRRWILLLWVGGVRRGWCVAGGCCWHRRGELGGRRRFLESGVGEGLVFAEVGDRAAEWIDGDEIVGNLVHDDELDVCGEFVASACDVVEL